MPLLVDKKQKLKDDGDSIEPFVSPEQPKSYRDYYNELINKQNALANYTESQGVVDAKNQRDSLAKPNAFDSSAYDAKNAYLSEKLAGLVNPYNNQQPFKYDLNGDALYEQYKQQYMKQGNLAMRDAIGRASAMTGGYGNSYGAVAGNQAYQGSLEKLNDVVPQLYEAAYSRYRNNLEDQYNKYAIDRQAINDQMSLNENTRDNAYDIYRDEVNDYYKDYSMYDTAYKNALDKDYANWQTENKNVQAQIDAINTYFDEENVEAYTIADVERILQEVDENGKLIYEEPAAAIWSMWKAGHIDYPTYLALADEYGLYNGATKHTSMTPAYIEAHPETRLQTEEDTTQAENGSTNKTSTSTTSKAKSKKNQYRYGALR